MTNNDDFTTTNGQYVPSDEDAADNYVFGRGSEDPGLSLPELRAEYGPEFDRFLARVRREALDGLAEARAAKAAAQEPTGLDDAETYRKIAAEIEWHIRTASARGYARAKGTDLPDGVIDAQIESAVRAITTIAARAAQRDEEK